MHEGGLAHGLLDEALALAGGRRLTRIVFRVGVLSGLAPESLEMHLEASMAEHELDGVAIKSHVAPARLKCACGREFETMKMTDPCPACASLIGRTILSGRECDLEAVEVS
ncbi:MAG: hydrogenase maturation nickel metallochaperone HypA [Candidatus Coatesbacteria bacterium]